MTVFDWAVAGVLLLSTLMAFWRGAVRVVVSLATWVIAFVAAIHWSAALASAMPEFGHNGAARYVLAFALILVAVLIAGTLIGVLLSRAVRAIGLGFLDRALGGVLGLARGVLIVLIMVLLAGMTPLPQRDWWQNAWLGPPLTVAALSLRPWLPKAWAERLYFGADQRRAPHAAGTRV